ncbi:hypothetical protein HFD88_002095 [Aspergillus terreus]|nr:hypothetical protein HFD88_002095 [Aspergillus terreus]
MKAMQIPFAAPSPSRLLARFAHKSQIESPLPPPFDSPQSQHFHLDPTSYTSPAAMGKVHGSLARAGKVKSATPKVEKQEKPKQPKGRALKRVKYTRRFVNVTMTGGKRKVRLERSNRIPITVLGHGDALSVP